MVQYELDLSLHSYVNAFNITIVVLTSNINKHNYLLETINISCFFIPALRYHLGKLR